MKILLEKLKGKLKDSNAVLLVVAPVFLLAMFSMPVLGIVSGRICKECRNGGSGLAVIAITICVWFVYETTVGFGEALCGAFHWPDSRKYIIGCILFWIYLALAIYMDNSMIQSEREEQEKKPNSNFY